MGPDHDGTLTVVNNLALLYANAGRYVEAEPLNKRVLESRERSLGKDHPTTLVSLNNLAILYVNQGQYEKAEPLLKRALEASERVLGNEHPQTLTRLGNLMALYATRAATPRPSRLPSARSKRASARLARTTPHAVQHQQSSVFFMCIRPV